MSVDNKGFEIKENKGTEVYLCVCTYAQVCAYHHLRNDDQGMHAFKANGSKVLNEVKSGHLWLCCQAEEQCEGLRQVNTWHVQDTEREIEWLEDNE